MLRLPVQRFRMDSDLSIMTHFKTVGSTAFERHSQSIFPSSLRSFQKTNAMGLPISTNNGTFVLATLYSPDPFFGSSCNIKPAIFCFSTTSFHLVWHWLHLAYFPTIPESSYALVEPHTGHCGSSCC